MAAMSQQDQLLLTKLLTALACLTVRSTPLVRGHVVEILARDHQREVVDAVAKRSVAA